MRMTEIAARTLRNKACMMVFGKPERENVEFVIAGEHGIERRQIA